MKRFILPFAFLMLPFLSFTQEEETIYTDTVDIVDFLEDVYLDGGKYKSKNGFYILKNTVITSESVVLNDSLYEDARQRILNAEEGFDEDSIYSFVSGNTFERLNNRIPIKEDSFYFNQKIIIQNCQFPYPEFYIDYVLQVGYESPNAVTFNKLDFSYLKFTGNSGMESILFLDCIFNEVYYSWYDNDLSIGFDNCVFKKKFKLRSKKELRLDNSTFLNGCGLYIENDIYIDNCTFQIEYCDTLFHNLEDKKIHVYPGLYSYQKMEDFDSIQKGYLNGIQRIGGELLDIDTDFENENEETVETITITNSTFFSTCSESWVSIKTHSKNLVIKNNDIPYKINFHDSKIENSFNLYGNINLKGISIENLLFSELKNYVDWNSISSFRLVFKNEHDGWYSDYLYRYNTGIDRIVISDEARYNKAIEMYKFLFDNYRKQGNTLSANGCYAEMKQVETQRWKYLYKNDKSFESFFRWQLNVFLSFFTDYGTNPAKAVIKSWWVILLFAVFYLFFPSDWDVSNRSQLLLKLTELTSKNREKSFASTLGFIAYSSFIHVLNALTLSLNAFTTLGFGDIPTRGAARYVTIVQGFIGWFLLTIFSVSLINQVLA